MLSGVAWKDTTSSSIGGTGPYIPKMLLGKFDSEEERESRRRFYREKKRDEQVRNSITAVTLLRKEGMISAAVASELESKAHDHDGIPYLDVSNFSVHVSSHSYSFGGNEYVTSYVYSNDEL